MKRHLSSRGTRKTAVIAAVFAMAASSCAAAASATDGAGSTGAAANVLLAPAHAPDIVLILTDDQRFDTLWAMPTVESELVGKGIEFTNGYVSNPLCCPSRAAILSGEYSHSNGVYTNIPTQPYGGFPAFRDRSTVATWLQGGGYRTALIGKYLNGYRGKYVPPGWDRWFVTWSEGAYFNYTANSNGQLRSFGSLPADYGTQVLGNKAADFIRTTDPNQPLFLYFAPHAPHSPATPAPGDAQAFSDLPPWRPPSFDETDVSDKPAYVQAHDPISDAKAKKIGQFRTDQYSTLLAVDRAVRQILDALTTTGRLSNTMIVFMSDNGYLWGEHRWYAKQVPYEEGIRVPFVVRDDALIQTPRTDGHLVANIDLAPTFAALAGVGAPNVDGQSLLPLLTSTNAPWRSDFLLELLNLGSEGAPTFCGVHSKRYVYVDYGTGEEELYDLVRDPYEMQNVVHSAGYAEVLLAMRRRLKQLCDPVPPGFSFSY
jgi:N-acetylglucosamine-6-sulfatase